MPSGEYGHYAIQPRRSLKNSEMFDIEEFMGEIRLYPILDRLLESVQEKSCERTAHSEVGYNLVTLR
jgi:hypothetical protein